MQFRISPPLMDLSYCSPPHSQYPRIVFLFTIWLLSLQGGHAARTSVAHGMERMRRGTDDHVALPGTPPRQLPGSSANLSAQAKQAENEHTPPKVNPQQASDKM